MSGTIERERKTEALQFHLQTQTNLLDDEIVRLNEFLLSVQAEISDAKDQYQQLCISFDQKQRKLSGEEIKKDVNKKALISQIMSNHYQNTSRLGEEHTKQIQRIHDDFENYFSQVEDYMNQKMSQRISQIETKIEHTRNRIERMRNDSQTARHTGKSSKNSIYESTVSSKTEESLIHRLEETLKQKSIEKLETLQSCQQQLEDCLNVLEDMKRDYSIKAEDYQKQLEAMDAKHKEKVAKETEKQKKEISQLKQKLKETVKRAEDVQAATMRSSASMKEELKTMLIDNQHLRSTVVNANTYSASVDSYKQISEEKDKLNAIISEREVNENRLTDARTRNDMLKREIAREIGRAHV